MPAMSRLPDFANVNFADASIGDAAAAGAGALYRGAEERETYRSAGVQTFFFVGCDALATLRSAHVMLTSK